jgi:D-alanyl-D-alanine carboxypeptidase
MVRHAWLFAFLSAALAIVGCEGKMDQTIVNRNDRVMKFLDAEIAASRYPGIQYVVVSARERLFEYDSGYADAKNAVPMSPATTMMAYSMTKTFTAVAVLQLVEQGKVSLDEAVRHYLPTFPYGSNVTVRHLLSQTSGLPNPIPLRWVHTASADASFNESAALESVMSKNAKLSFPPGTKYAYSNISYWLLGQIIERANGEPYKRYMERHIFAPLGLTPGDASFSIVGPSNHAKGYLARWSALNLLKGLLIDRELAGETVGKWVNIRDHYLNGAAFGGLITTARAVSLFLQDQLKERSVLLGPQFREQFFTQQRTTTNAPVSMTLGWHIGDLHGTRFFYKEGGGGGYHCEMRIYPERAIGSVIMVNETSSSCIRTQDLADWEFLK